jgi:hypothetical protein
MLPSSEGSKYITIPVSWGLKPIKVIADQTYDVATGKSGDAYETAGKIASSFVDAYNPVGGTDMTSAITPSPLDVPVEIARNQKWSGSMIRNDKELVPNHQNYFSSLNNSLLGKASIATTEKVAESTGNKISINPADMAYALEQYIGGAGRSAERFGSTIVNTLQGKATEVKNIPFVNRFVKTQNLTYKDKGNFEKQLKGMKAGSDEQRDFVQEYLWNQPKEDRQGIMYGLQLKGVYTKGLTVKDKSKALADRDIEAQGEAFLQSGKSSQIIGDKILRADNSERGYSVTPKIKYDTDLTTQKLENAKTAKNMTEWMKLAEQQEKNLTTQLQDPTLDELEKIELQQKYDKLVTDAQKYASYGGFTKGGGSSKAKKEKTYNLATVQKVNIKTAKPAYTTKIRSQRPKRVKFKSPKIKTYKLKAPKAPKLKKLRSY